MTLLEKAKQAEVVIKPRKKSSNIREQAELVSAYCGGSVSLEQVRIALNCKETSTYNLIAGILLRCVRAGEIDIKLKAL